MGGKTPRATDRRVQRTRRALTEALVALIIERGWDAINIQDMCERADVGRSTFYTHFADKEELVIAGLNDLHKALRAHGGTSGNVAGQDLGFALGLIEHVHEQQRFVRAVLGKRGAPVVQLRFRRLVLSLVKEDLAARADPSERLDATAHYIAGAFVELLTWWLETRRSLSPTEVNKLFQDLTAPALAALRKLG